MLAGIAAFAVVVSVAVLFQIVRGVERIGVTTWAFLSAAGIGTAVLAVRLWTYGSFGTVGDCLACGIAIAMVGSLIALRRHVRKRLGREEKHGQGAG